MRKLICNVLAFGALLMQFIEPVKADPNTNAKPLAVVVKPTDEESQLSSEERQTLEALRKQKHISQSTVMTIDAKILEEDQLSITMPDGNATRFDKRRGQKDGPFTHWSGRSQTGDTAVFTSNGECVTGKLLVTQKTYAIRCLSGRNHYMAAIDLTKLPPIDAGPGHPLPTDKEDQK